MICPYNVISETEVQQWGQNTDEMATGGTTITKTTYQYMECKQNDCGAFYNGICHYSKLDSE